MKLTGSNPTPQIEGLDRLPGTSNYFIGNDPKKRRTRVYGLRQDSETRSKLAFVNEGGGGDYPYGGANSYSIRIYDCGEPGQGTGDGAFISSMP